MERAAALHELQKLRGFAAALDAAEMSLQETFGMGAWRNLESLVGKSWWQRGVSILKDSP